MSAINIPGFTADRSLQAARGRYRGKRPSASPTGAVVPAIPKCSNCEEILDRCANNGWRPRGLCNLCAAGWCYDDPPLPNPFPDPFPKPPRF